MVRDILKKARAEAGMGARFGAVVIFGI